MSDANQAKTSVAMIAAMIWTRMNIGASSGRIPAKVSENDLAIVTAGFAKDVDDVNQYPAVMNNPTA